MRCFFDAARSLRASASTLSSATKRASKVEVESHQGTAADLIFLFLPRSLSQPPPEEWKCKNNACHDESGGTPPHCADRHTRSKRFAGEVQPVVFPNSKRGLPSLRFPDTLSSHAFRVPHCRSFLSLLTLSILVPLALKLYVPQLFPSSQT